VNVAPKKPAEKDGLISDVVADSPHKIFIAGVAGVISSEMLMEIASAFGPLAAYRFLFNDELGGPCAFLETVCRSFHYIQGMCWPEWDEAWWMYTDCCPCVS